MSYRSYSYITELILVFRILYVYYGTYTCLTELILVLQSLFLYFRSYTFITEHILVLQILYLYYGAYSCILDTEVPIGTIEHFTCTKVPAGTTEQIQRHPLHSDLYHIHFFTLIFYSES